MPELEMKSNEPLRAVHSSFDSKRERRLRLCGVVGLGEEERRRAEGVPRDGGGVFFSWFRQETN